MAIFEFSIASGTSDVHSLSMGNLTIVGNQGTATSEENRRYLMMVFPSITLLLDNLRIFLLKESSRQCEFIGVDGSFEAVFLKENSEIIVLKTFGKIISRESKTQLIQELWSNIESFVHHYRAQFQDTDTGVRDLDEAMKDFSKAFATILAN